MQVEGRRCLRGEEVGLRHVVTVHHAAGGQFAPPLHAVAPKPNTDRVKGAVVDVAVRCFAPVKGVDPHVKVQEIPRDPHCLGGRKHIVALAGFVEAGGWPIQRCVRHRGAGGLHDGGRWAGRQRRQRFSACRRVCRLGTSARRRIRLRALDASGYAESEVVCADANVPRRDPHKARTVANPRMKASSSCTVAVSVTRSALFRTQMVVARWEACQWHSP